MLSKPWHNEKRHLEDESVKMTKDTFLLWVSYECFDIGEVSFLHLGSKKRKRLIEITWKKKLIKVKFKQDVQDKITDSAVSFLNHEWPIFNQTDNIYFQGVISHRLFNFWVLY